MDTLHLERLTSPILFRGDDKTACRDPAAVYADGWFHLFFTLVETEDNGQVYMYLAKSRSRDLVHWEPVRKLTPRDQRLNFSSPGNVVRHEDKWVLCLQTYCRENGEKYGNERSRLWTMRSENLADWEEPVLLRVKGDVPEEEMGRMIDPYLVEDVSEKGKWWCLYKQRGMSLSYSYDLKNWIYHGRVDCGENVCAIREGEGLRIYHSPQNGIGMLRTKDMVHFEPCGELITLGQDRWPWAQGRITAGFVLDLTMNAEFGKYLMFFHGSGPEDEETMFDHHASIGLAWSDEIGFDAWK